MRVVVAHNRYKYAGGEDTAMRAEVEMLREHGHAVELLEADNRTIVGTVAKIAAAGRAFHSFSASERMRELVRRFRPDVVHVHNWFPLLSPGIIGAARAGWGERQMRGSLRSALKRFGRDDASHFVLGRDDGRLSEAAEASVEMPAAREGVPVVQTLHNYRMFCANGVMYRDGKICEECAGKMLPTGAVQHACYAGSRVGSAVVTAAFAYHRLARTWDGVAKFIAVSEVQRELLVHGGMRAEQIVVKPNFVKDSGGPGDGKGGYALFVGRLIPEKGIRTVLEAWASGAVRAPLKIMGDGPLADEVRQRATRLPRVQYLGQQTNCEVRAAMAGAKYLIFASEWYEPFALTIVEALAQGTPVLAADLASVHELVHVGKTGMRFRVGDAADLAAKAATLTADEAAYRDMRRRCRALYEERYTDGANYRMLMGIYRGVCG
ncbi:MAG: glycosyltransferase family 4 protein [Acidobacteriaceae bacterium]|jgi:glycosyltransferase involved in cell wall biosynthesis